MPVSQSKRATISLHIQHIQFHSIFREITAIEHTIDCVRKNSIRDLHDGRCSRQNAVVAFASDIFISPSRTLCMPVCTHILKTLLLYDFHRTFVVGISVSSFAAGWSESVRVRPTRAGDTRWCVDGVEGLAKHCRMNIVGWRWLRAPASAAQLQLPCESVIAYICVMRVYLHTPSRTLGQLWTSQSPSIMCKERHKETHA